MGVMKRARQPANARQRILETAESLFYSEGVRAVGIDRIIAEAEVAKMSLYNHFPSKDDLILAVLKFREVKFNGIIESRMEHHRLKGKNRLDAFFAALKDWFELPGFRGCAFINATAELADARHPASKFCADHKERFQEMLRAIIVEVAGEKAGAAAESVALLVEGAIVLAVMEGSSTPAETARDAAMTLIAKAKRG